MTESQTSPLLERVPPQNLEAEQSVLGAMLIEQDAIIRADAILSGTDFYRDAHRCIFETITDMRDRGEAVDLITLSETLKTKGLFDEIGGMAYLTTLATFTPTAANIEDYSRIVKDKSLRRQLIIEAQRTITRAAEDDEPADRQVSAAVTRMMQLTMAVSSDSNIRDLSDILRTRLEQYEEARTKRGIIGWPTGISDLDEATGGLHNGEVTILAARPSVGKTALAMQIATHGAKLRNQTVLFASQEMPGEALADRLIGAATGIQPSALRSGRIAEDQWTKIARAMNSLSVIPLKIDDGRLTTDRIWSEARKHALQLRDSKPLGLIVIDYLQLLSDPGERGQSENQRVSNMSHRLKAMARDLNVPVLCLSQLSRENEKEGGRPPRLSDLRDSGAIEQDADTVILLHVKTHKRPELDDSKKDPRPTTLMIAKQRMGPVGNILLMFHRTKVQFEQVDTRHEEPRPEQTTFPDTRPGGRNRLGEYDKDEEDEHE